MIIGEQLKHLPDKAGVYLMYDKDDEIIYVGKAKSLKNRVKSYFQRQRQDSTKIRVMVSHIVRFEYIIVDTEAEALVLESNLIKEHKPKYNILLRDDKQYPYILITDEKYPRILKERRIEKNKGEYFGPYPNAYAVNDLLELFHEVYPLRNCNLNFDRGDSLKRACLNHFIGRCMAPCIGKADEIIYNEAIEKARKFLRGQNDDLINEIKEKMFEASDQLKFEKAARYRDNLLSIEKLLEKQSISTTQNIDIDLIAMARSDRNVCVQIFFMRNGKTVEREHFILEDDYKEEDGEILRAFMLQYYANSAYLPGEILVDAYIKDREPMEEWFSNRRGSGVKIHRPMRGQKYDLLDTVRLNAKDMLKKYEEKINRRERTKPLGLEHLSELLGIKNLHRIEAYDISNISGAQNVGSMVVFLDGEKANREYRKFKIKEASDKDDVGALKEVLKRRFHRGLKDKNKESGFGQLPQLILIDGGKGQVNGALNIIKEIGLSTPVAGLVKDQFHNTRGLIWQNEEIDLSIRSPLYRLLYSIQEEAHRFAFDYHRHLRNKNMKKTVLDDIPLIGEKRKNALLKAFKTIPGIQTAKFEELVQVPSMNKKAAQNIIEFFSGEKNESSKIE